MRTLTWLAHRYRLARRPMPWVLIAAFGFGAFAKADDPAPKDAPVLKVSREQPKLGRPERLLPDQESSSRRVAVTTTGESQSNQITVNGKTQPTSPQPQVAASVTESTLVETRAQQPASDGWVPRRGTSPRSANAPGNVESEKKTAASAAPRVAARPQYSSGATSRGNSTGAPIVDPPSLSEGTASATAGTTSQSSGAAPEANSIAQQPGLKPVPRMRPPAAATDAVESTAPQTEAPKTQSEQPNRGASDSAINGAQEGDGFRPRWGSAGDDVLGSETDYPVEPRPSGSLGGNTEQSSQSRSSQTPVGSPRETFEQHAQELPDEPDMLGFEAGAESELEINEDRDIPVRRPSIAGSSPVAIDRDPGLDSTVNRPPAASNRSHILQEQIERFERETSPSDPTADDLYEHPELDAEVDTLDKTENGPGPQLERVKPAPVISAAALRLEKPIAQCLQYYYVRPENARQRTPWGMLHAILPFEQDALITNGRTRYNAIAWLSGNNPCRNLRLLSMTRSGGIAARSGIGLQGHQAQFLAILAQVNVPQTYGLRVNRKKFTVADLVRAEMAGCKAGEELTFTLIGLSHYLPTDTRWRTADGQEWDFERLIKEELAQPVVGAACGGTHRLMGLSYALRQRRMEGLPIEGQWKRAETYINDFVDYAWSLQNRDGSFSTNWFEGAEDNGNLDRKVQTSGHILEWLLFEASNDELQDDRMMRGITFLANSMIANRQNDWQVGPKGHALRALSLYHRRVFGSEQPWLAETKRRQANSAVRSAR